MTSFGAVHMAMHGSAEDSRRLKKQVAFYRETAEALQNTGKTIRSEIRALKRENRRLKSLSPDNPNPEERVSGR